MSEFAVLTVPPRRVGDGEIGGKAQGLLFFSDMLGAEFDAARFSEFEVGVPRFDVITTGPFDAFLETGGLRGIADAERTDAEILEAFLATPLPREVEDYVAELVESCDRPLAVRSSSILEDAIFCPFAGVYATKMIPNNHADRRVRAGRLSDAIRQVWASTFSHNARRYLRSTNKPDGAEKMAVIVQEVVGVGHGERFYPQVSGVGRSYDFYPVSGGRPEDGVVQLGLGLGKIIVDSGVTWSFSPVRPKAPPPFGSVDEILHNTQVRFWSVNLGGTEGGQRGTETEHLVDSDLSAAEGDGSLSLVASTYDGRADRLVPGVGCEGPRVLNFAPLLVLNAPPLAPLVRELLTICERAAGAAVEIEFAITLDRESGRGRFGFLQVRPMVVSHGEVEVTTEDWDASDVLVASDRAMGNGCIEDIRDVVYVKPESFEARHTPAIAAEIERLSTPLMDSRTPYMLIGFGRWGSSDPWLGIPVEWAQICGVRVLVEASLPQMNVDPSQGSHFFQNLTSFGVQYLAVGRGRGRPIDWDWLQARRTVDEGPFVRHVRLERPLDARVDGRSGRGVVRTP